MVESKIIANVGIQVSGPKLASKVKHQRIKDYVAQHVFARERQGPPEAAGGAPGAERTPPVRQAAVQVQHGSVGPVKRVNFASLNAQSFSSRRNLSRMLSKTSIQSKYFGKFCSQE